MRKTINLWQLMGFAVTSLLGTLLHYLYDWTGEATWAALFSGINESTWEHMKLLFVPMFLFAILQSFFAGREFENFWCVKLQGILLGILLIPTLFYTLNGAFGKTPDWINIAIFFVSAAVAYVYETRQFSLGSTPTKHPKRGLVILIGIAALFVLFTFMTPTIPLFRDPMTGVYGLGA